MDLVPNNRMTNPSDIDVTILTRSGPISIREFAEFLKLFRDCYAIAMDSWVSIGPGYGNTFEQEVARQVAHTKSHLVKLRKIDLKYLANRPLSVEPGIVTMSRENPTKLKLNGLAILLTVATVISGGKFEVTPTGGVKVELPALGEGLAKLRDALKI